MHERYKHPELRVGEVFWINVPVREFLGGMILFSPTFKAIKWRSKRLGGIAYDSEGRVLKDHRPVIVSISEVEEKGVVLNQVGPATASWWDE
jgi:hypothetical protein